MIVIDLHQSIQASPATVMALLLDHVNLSRFFDAKFSLTQTQDRDEPDGGKGTIRQVSIGRITFLEQIIKAEPGHICYQILGSAPVSEHQGNIYLTQDSEIISTGEHGAGEQATRLHYVIRFKGPKWLPDFIVKAVIARELTRTLGKIASFCDEC
jgi:hypothetical protein